MRKEFQYVIIACLLGSSFLLARHTAALVNEHSMEASAAASENTCIVIDAGHGGNDPGKIGINDILEKDINLSIAQKLQKLLENKGITVVMTRDEDKCLASEDASNLKREDMENRVAIIQQYNPVLTVSIHQNSYSSESVSGPQVFYYAKSEEGATLAAVIQESLNTRLNPENKRMVKANDNYYLLKNTPTPTVIVECGFLSNPTEADLLKTDAYQNQVTRAIYLGICEYISLQDTNV